MTNVAYAIKARLERSERIVFTDYAEHRASDRQVNLAEVQDNLLNPRNLLWAEEQQIRGETRYACYLVHKRRIVRCVIVFEEERVLVMNIIKQKQPWKRIQKNLH